MGDHNEAYLRLATEIIKQSVKDYKAALKLLKSENIVDEDWLLKKDFERCKVSVQNAWRIKCDCEKFFLSDWYTELYTGVLDVSVTSDMYTGLEVMMKLREDVANGRRKTTWSNSLA